MAWIVKCLSSSRDSKSASASLIGAIVVDLLRVEVWGGGGVLKFARARAHPVHEVITHGTRTNTVASLECGAANLNQHSPALLPVS
jgi:hypothetical protein